MTNHGSLVPDFIEAVSPKNLRLLMIKTNNLKNQKHEYFDIQHFVNKRGKVVWIAWFYTNLTGEDIKKLDE